MSPARPLARFVGIAAALVFAAACASKQNFESQRLPDGTLRLACSAPLQSCLAHADVLCKGAAYEVLRARDQRDRYGGELGTGQVEVRMSEAVIRCGASDEPLSAPPAPRLPAPAPPPHRPPAPVVAKNVCVPGSTQACVGPGACAGGQSCLPNGSSFGPCDCGTLGPPLPSPSAAPPSAAPSAAPSAGPPAPAPARAVPSAPPGLPSSRQPRKPGPAPVQDATPLEAPRP